MEPGKNAETDQGVGNGGWGTKIFFSSFDPLPLAYFFSWKSKDNLEITKSQRSENFVSAQCCSVHSYNAARPPRNVTRTSSHATPPSRGLWQAGYKRFLDITKWPCHVFY